MILPFFSKAALPLIMIAACLLGAAGLGLQAVSTVQSIIENTRTRAIAGRDTYWKGEIQRIELETARSVAAQRQEVVRLQAEAENKTRAAEQLLDELEKKNAALPNGGDVGLSADRGRMLPN